jgi:sialidase-1
VRQLVILEKFVVSRDDNIYESWPDAAMVNSEKMMCVFSECAHHSDRSYTRIMLTESSDRGRTWTPKRGLTEGTGDCDYYYDCARIQKLKDGRLLVIVDRNYGTGTRNSVILLYFSNDDGQTWAKPVETPARGIVPDKLLETDSGRWIISCHCDDDGFLAQRLWYSDDKGKSWNGPVFVGKKEGLNLCEASILQVDDSLVAFMRENSGIGLPCYKTISRDNGESWSDPITFPLPACHRPVSGYLNNGRIMITHRFMQGGKGWLGAWTQNFFAGITDKKSALANDYKGASTRIIPIDYDPSPKSDLGYSGWVQFADGEIYIVNYIVDDADKAFIRGYSLKL